MTTVVTLRQEKH